MLMFAIHSSVFKFWHSNVIRFVQIVIGTRGSAVLDNIWTNMDKV